MKRRIIRCERCNDETLHLVSKKTAHRRTSWYTRREVKHCTGCNMRTIKNKKTGVRIIR